MSPGVSARNASDVPVRSLASTTARLPTIVSDCEPSKSTVLCSSIGSRFPAKTTVPIAELPLASSIAALNEPAPASFEFVTVALPAAAFDDVAAPIAATTSAIAPSTGRYRIQPLPELIEAMLACRASHLGIRPVTGR
jgi:hypothetical protein